MVCQHCTEALNAINGRYCKRLGRYVEHDREPPCLPDKRKEAERG